MGTWKGSPGAKEYVAINLVMCALIAAGVFLGAGTLFFMVLVPACLILVVVRYPSAYVAGTVILCAVFPSLLMLSVFLDIIFFSVPPALLMGLMFKQRRGLVAVLTMGVIGCLISWLSLYFAGLAVSDSADTAALTTSFFGMIDEAVNEAAQAYGFTAEQRSMLYNMFVSIMPALFLCGCALLCYITFLIARAVLVRFGLRYNYFLPFRMARADRVSALVFAAALLFSLFTDGLAGQVIINVVVVTASLMMICGFAFACFAISNLRMRFLRMFLYAVAFVLLPALAYLYMLLGFIDAFVDLRRAFKGVGV